MSERTTRIVMGFGYAVCASVIALVAVAIVRPDVLANTASSTVAVDESQPPPIEENPPNASAITEINAVNDVSPPALKPPNYKTPPPYLTKSDTPTPTPKSNHVLEEIENSAVDAAWTIVVEDASVPIY